MIWEFGYRRSKMEKIYRRIRTVYTIANTGVFEVSNPKRPIYAGRKPPIFLIRHDNTRHNYPQ